MLFLSPLPCIAVGFLATTSMPENANPQVCVQNPEERNYHIFYEMLHGMSSADLSAYDLRPDAHYRMLNAGDTTKNSPENDKRKFGEIQEAFRAGKKKNAVLVGFSFCAEMGDLLRGAASAWTKFVIEETIIYYGMQKNFPQLAFPMRRLSRFTG